MGQPSNAKSAYEKVLEIDSNCSEATEGYKNCSVQSNSDPNAGALEDPEVQKILKNPAMMKVLQLMQNDPQAIQEHLNPPSLAESTKQTKKTQENSDSVLIDEDSDDDSNDDDEDLRGNSTFLILKMQFVIMTDLYVASETGF